MKLLIISLIILFLTSCISIQVSPDRIWPKGRAGDVR